MWYLMYRTMTGLHRKIEYSFTVVGHTKFSCDRAFGVLKKKPNLTELWTLYDIVDTVYKSGECNHPELVGFHDGRVAVKTYNWSEKLSLFFKKIDNITTFHHFKFDSEQPGIVECYTSLESEPTVLNLLKKKIPENLHEMPEIISPAGFSEERSNYLFNDIREYCKPGTEDLVAPCPSNKKHKTN